MLLMQDRNSERSTILVIIVCSAGSILYATILTREIFTKEGRSDLFAKRANIPDVGLFTKLLIWLVPILVVCANAAPFLILK